jgi:hypothetical protein
MYFLTMVLGIYALLFPRNEAHFTQEKLKGKLISFLLEVRTRIISWETFSFSFSLV